jgi:hypothetical protein
MSGRRFTRHLAVLTTCAVMLAACGAASLTPTAPSSTGGRSGVWLGTLNEVSGATGSLRLTLEERQVDTRRSLITGTWTASYQARSRDGAGTLTGTITDALATLLLVPSTPVECDQVLPLAAGAYSTGSLTVSATSIQGPYSQLLCAGTVTGTLTLTKQ